MNPFIPDNAAIERIERRRIITLAATVFAMSAITVISFLAVALPFMCGG
ncbi:MAG: hypothetical protein ACRCU5_13990 [Rhizobiaceae bacterium]